jgi:protein subunit release factor B
MFWLARVLHSFQIPRDRIELLYSRASGPGGQNIAASNSKVQLKFEIAKADWLSAEIRDVLAKQYGRVLVVVSQESRSCKQNEKICFSKLQDLLEQTEAFIKRPRTQFTSFEDWIKSVHTQKQVQRHKRLREEGKRVNAALRRNQRVEYD